MFKDYVLLSMYNVCVWVDAVRWDDFPAVGTRQKHKKLDMFIVITYFVGMLKWYQGFFNVFLQTGSA